MIADWRVKFNQSDMYFGFVQLAPWLDVSDSTTFLKLAGCRVHVSGTCTVVLNEIRSRESGLRPGRNFTRQCSQVEGYIAPGMPALTRLIEFH